MHLILCGGRDYALTGADWEWLDDLHATYHLQEVIVGSDTRTHDGKRRGADAHGLHWAKTRGIDTTVMDANWTRDDTAAGPIRNGRMLRYLLAHTQAPSTTGSPPTRAVVAFPGGPGTRDMCQRARRAGVPVWDGAERGRV